jgi:hypothetical protein
MVVVDRSDLHGLAHRAVALDEPHEALATGAADGGARDGMSAAGLGSDTRTSVVRVAGSSSMETQETVPSR